VARPVAVLGPEWKQAVLEAAVGSALSADSSTRELGLYRDDHAIVCTRLGGELDADAQEVIPLMSDVELAANGWMPPAGTVRLPIRTGLGSTSVLCVGWPDRG
jgi:hypothetical protein